MRIVIAGGGVMGSALAWWLAQRGRADLEILVVERDPTYARASSALSASSIRQQFSSRVNIEIGLFGIAFLREADRYLAVNGESTGVTVTERGYLVLASTAGAAIMRENHAIQQSCGADIRLLEPVEIEGAFPFIDPAGLALGAHGRTGEGWFDGYGLLQAFRKRAIALGVSFIKDEVTGLVTRAGRVERVETDSGTSLPCDVMVNTAGPWARRIAAMAGIDLPVHAKKRTVFSVTCPEPLPNCPLIADPSGFWMRPEGKGYITGCAPENDSEDERPLEPDWHLFEDRLWPALAARIPAMERLRVESAWAGYYEMNLFDHNGLVGLMPGLENAYVAAGFSGHGIQQSPAVGRGLAELILDGVFTTLDLADLGPDRIARGQPLVERNVI